ncbi:MAG: hypothetical protein DME42_04155 [Verrucomicrobia bacterium]|nr:MAG: hypothetical protein DME42_04155 [Verrucomicrobiota bacterium]
MRNVCCLIRRKVTALNTPLVFKPIFQERIWGGRKLEELFGKNIPAGKRIGESWEIVDRPEAQSLVRNGPLRGRTIHELWTQHRQEIFGDVPATARFPLAKQKPSFGTWRRRNRAPKSTLVCAGQWRESNSNTRSVPEQLQNVCTRSR